MLLYMIPELCVYGLFSGLLLKWFRTGHAYADLYLALVPAMLLGRIAGGIARAIFYLPSGQPYSLALWASSYLVGTLPGIILHLVILPPLVLLMMKARLIPQRYVSTLSLMNFSNTLDSAARHDDAQRFSWDEASAVRPY